MNWILLYRANTNATWCAIDGAVVPGMSFCLRCYDVDLIDIFCLFVYLGGMRRYYERFGWKNGGWDWKKKKKKRGKKGKYKFEFPESQQTNVEGKKLTLLRPAWVNQNGFAVKGYRCGPIEHVNQTEDIAGQWTIKHNHHTLSLDEWKAGSYLSYLCIWYPNAFTEAEFIVSFIWCYLSAFLSRCRVAHFGAVKDGLRITIYLNRERELW